MEDQVQHQYAQITPSGKQEVMTAVRFITQLRIVFRKKIQHYGLGRCAKTLIEGKRSIHLCPRKKRKEIFYFYNCLYLKLILF